MTIKHAKQGLKTNSSSAILFIYPRTKNNTQCHKSSKTSIMKRTERLK